MMLFALIFFWLATPESNVWDSPGNWSPAGPPGQNDVARFSGSQRSDIALEMAPAVSGLEFTGLEPYRLTVAPLAFFQLSGTISSTRTPEIVVEGSWSGSPGQMLATADGNLGNARVILKAVPGGNGGQLEIQGHGGRARLYVNSGSYLLFEQFGNADQAQILAKPGIQGMYGGQIYFFGNSQAENATIRLVGRNSNLQCQNHNGAITIGQLNGDGTVYLGSNTLNLKSGDYHGAIDGGTLSLSETSTFTVRTNRAMTTSGSMVVAGTLEVYFVGLPVLGHPYRLFSVAGSKTGDFQAIHFLNLPISHFTAGFMGNDYILTIP